MRTPSTGGIPAAIRRRLRSLRYAVADLFFVIGDWLRSAGRFLARLPRAVGRGFGRFWGSLSVIARRRLVAAIAVAVVIVAVLALAVPNLPCSFPGGDSCPPPDDAQGLVPSDALAYLHADLDRDSDQYRALTGLAGRVPLFRDQAVSRAVALIPGPRGAAIDFERDIEPWFGDEAAMAILPGSGSVADRVDLLGVADAEGASAFAASVAGPRAETQDYDGAPLTTGARGISSAQTDGFLVIGSGDGVRAVLDTATGVEGSASLSENDQAAAVRDRLPADRFADAWLSADGVSQLIAGGRGLVSTLTPLLAPGATTGAAASLSASGDALELAVRSELDPDREQASPGFFDAFPPFEPRLPSRLRPGTLAYVGFGDPGGTAAALLGQAAAEAPGIASGFRDLVANLQREGGTDLTKLAGALGDEAAIAVEPGAASGQPDPGEAAAPSFPYLLLVASGVDEGTARDALAQLQGPLAEAVGSSGQLQAPAFGEQQIEGVEASSLTVSPTVELTYAVFDGLAAIATDPAGIAGLAGGDGGLDDTDLYRSATDGFGDQPSLLAFLDLAGLVQLGEQSGLAEDPAYATFAADFRNLTALGLEITDDDDLLATDARLLLGGGSTGAETSTVPSPAD